MKSAVENNSHLLSHSSVGHKSGAQRVFCLRSHEVKVNVLTVCALI